MVFVRGGLSDYRYWVKPLSIWTSALRLIDGRLRHFYPKKWDRKSVDLTTPQHVEDRIAFIEIGMIAATG